MDFLFFSVVAVCATALACYRMHLAARSAITVAQFEAAIARLDKLEGRTDKLSVSKVGR